MTRDRKPANSEWPEYQKLCFRRGESTLRRFIPPETLDLGMKGSLIYVQGCLFHYFRKSRMGM
ncbi:MAG TPA: hypothetical protein DEA96_05825, partial [Leptospiraceae bacterium]|nr:hypothetical protein [Leptospiraceae bacterium]